ncbi:hypothetical protein GCM10022402_25520 [Salinactinospora qingdaonensis]|uniref:arginine--tRNA ligase n=1 Tax=Salinactinospora qingdaonensis TaxID=702744 RepID=A0ABP7FPW4_9ACTN
MLRTAAASVLGADHNPPTRLPAAEPRQAPDGAAGDYSTALALRLSRSSGRPARELADEVAAELRRQPGIGDAVAEGPGFITVTPLPAVRRALLRAASLGPAYLTGRPEGFGRCGEHPAWALTPLHRAATLAQARQWARDDARHRLALAAGHDIAPAEAPGAGVDTAASENPPTRSPRAAETAGADEGDGTGRGEAPEETTAISCPCATEEFATGGRGGRRAAEGVAARCADAVDGGWRDPYYDAPPGETEPARLLAVLGEAATRIAYCRSADQQPRPGERTGPDLPAWPTARRPGAWARHTADNPAFALRYAHAHARSTLRWAHDSATVDDLPARPASASHESSAPQGDGAHALAALASSTAVEVTGLLFDGPGLLAASARRRSPHTLVRYLEGLAVAYHDWWESCDAVTGRDIGPAGAGAARGEAVAARLDLCAAVCGVLAAGLAVLGVSAPARL